MISNSKDLSWGRVFDFEQKIEKCSWLDETIKSAKSLNQHSESYLPYGKGRSYGDSCLNPKGTLLDLSGLNRIVSFNSQTGVLRCEAGMTFEEILQFSVPRGWFLPVTPGTMYVTTGGAIGNDVHGKNHHLSGTLGCHIEKFGLLRSDGQIFECSSTENESFYRSTIGGLGLTGCILWADIRLKKIYSPNINQEIIQFSNLDEFLKIDEESQEKFEYTVSWIDSLATGHSLAKGLYIRGNHCELISRSEEMFYQPNSHLVVPFDLPTFVLNKLSVTIFNKLYYHKQRGKKISGKTNFQSFFYPLDSVTAWNNCYGKKGFRQFQFVLPKNKVDILKIILEKSAKSGYSSFLTVLKKFGDVKSPGLLSFPKEGYTAALDFANKGEKTDRFLRELADLVLENDGRIYPAKDSLMSKEQFVSSFPDWQKLEALRDPLINSRFWQRVTGG